MTDFPQECSSIRKSHDFALSTYTQTASVSPDTPNHCGCKGFEFRGNCKHLREAVDSLCSWTTESDLKQSPQQEMMAECPKCGAETVALMQDSSF